MDDTLIGCVVIFLFGAVAFLLWGVISPEGMWRSTQAWQYKNPEANEPSEAAFTTMRVSGIISILVLLCTACFIMDIGNIASGSTEEEQEYEACLEEHEDDWLSDDESDEPWDSSTDDPLSNNDPWDSSDDPWDSTEDDWDVEGGNSAEDECDYLSPEPE